MKFALKLTDDDQQCLVHQEAFVLDMVDRYDLTDCNKSPRVTPFKTGSPSCQILFKQSITWSFFSHKQPSRLQSFVFFFNPQLTDRIYQFKLGTNWCFSSQTKHIMSRSSTSITPFNFGLDNLTPLNPSCKGISMPKGHCPKLLSSWCTCY